MKPADALRSATSITADVLCRSKDLGRVASRFVADLVAFRGDPRSRTRLGTATCSS